jgi:hypothetical protein
MHGVVAQVEGWAAELDRLCERISPGSPGRRSAGASPGFVPGLLGDVEGKNGWQLAEQAGERTRMGCSGC